MGSRSSSRAKRDPASVVRAQLDSGVTTGILPVVTASGCGFVRLRLHLIDDACQVLFQRTFWRPTEDSF